VLVRLVAIALALWRTRLDARERVVAAWFGPKGFASSTDVPMARWFRGEAPARA
jgi:NhaP-type Na+/H+ or K+/H+ antiporter